VTNNGDQSLRSSPLPPLLPTHLCVPVIPEHNHTNFSALRGTSMKTIKGAVSGVKNLKPWRDDTLSQKSGSSQKPPATPRNILAFRTITTLLRFIQQDKQLKMTHPDSQTSNDRYQLSILNALATVAVIDHEIIAISSMNTSPSGLELVASTTQSEVPAQHSGIWDKFPWPNFLLTHNSEFSKPKRNTPTGYPTLDELVKPDFIGESDEELRQYLAEQHTQLGL
jgi:hypothetical protein